MAIISQVLVFFDLWTRFFVVLDFYYYYVYEIIKKRLDKNEIEHLKIHHTHSLYD